MDPPAKCSSCGNAASNRCKNCLVHVYCNVDCQKHDWPTHKVICKEIQMETFIPRAASLLKELYLIFREATFSIGISQVTTEKSGKIVIHSSPIDSACSSSIYSNWYFPFPNHKVGADAKKPILCAWMCTDVIACMNKTVEKIFKGSQIEVREVDLAIDSPDQIVEVIHFNGHKMYNWPHAHSMICAMSRFPGGKMWLLDLTGEQYGITQSAWKLEEYNIKYNAHVYEMSPLGNIAEFFNLLAAMEGPKHTADTLEATAFLNKGIENWEKKHEFRLSDLMKMPNDKFDGKRVDLLETMRKEMTAYIANIDIPSKLLKMDIHDSFFPSEKVSVKDVARDFRERKIRTSQTTRFSDPDVMGGARREHTRKKFGMSWQEMETRSHYARVFGGMLDLFCRSWAVIRPWFGWCV